ncbi:hypothetical protein TNCV_278961 [Trichonephila clavipes]|nr:hypothetical protein TNCV_278961 [Trichonephila clavipes]
MRWGTTDLHQDPIASFAVRIRLEHIHVINFRIEYLIATFLIQFLFGVGFVDLRLFESHFAVVFSAAQIHAVFDLFVCFPRLSLAGIIRKPERPQKRHIPIRHAERSPQMLWQWEARSDTNLRPYKPKRLTEQT